jgi:hypothetical protein
MYICLLYDVTTNNVVPAYSLKVGEAFTHDHEIYNYIDESRFKYHVVKNLIHPNYRTSLETSQGYHTSHNALVKKKL